jgi:hypothetical protein
VLCAQSGWTPLHFAASRGHASVVTLLCERGADKEANDNVRTRHAHAHTHTHALLHMDAHIAQRAAAARKRRRRRRRLCHALSHPSPLRMCHERPRSAAPCLPRRAGWQDADGLGHG